ncbi:MAG TPA: hypothetical protein VN371_10060 [Chlorobaculum sp.]|nr:hypothetical protein [Chlorobaculum sp.]
MAALIFPILVLFGSLTASATSYSAGPRATGVEILDELLQGPHGFIIRVGSNGCTSRNSFEVRVNKEIGISERAPHYVLTVIRKGPDECKAIVDDGVVIVYDLQKDLGISGNYTYTVANPVASAHPFKTGGDSFFSMVVKQTAPSMPGPGESRPLPYENFTIEHGYFSCLVPSDWQRVHDGSSNDKEGIHEIRLTLSGKAKPEDGERFYFPDPLLYVGYYSPGNRQGKTYEGFIADYEKLMRKNAGSPKSRYRRPEKTVIGRNEATVNSYEVFQETQRGPLFTTRYWMKARFVVIKAHQGFYVVAFKSPREFYDKYLPVFQAVLDSFKPLY